MPLPLTPPSGGLPDKKQGIPTRPDANIPSRANKNDQSLPSAPSIPTRSPAGIPTRPIRPDSVTAPSGTDKILPPLPAAPAHTPSIPDSTPSPAPSTAQQEIPDFLKQSPTGPAPSSGIPVSAPEHKVDSLHTAPPEPKKKKGFRETSNHDPKAGKRSKGSKNVLRYSTIGLLIILCGLGAKSAFIPPKAPSTQEVVTAVQESLGNSGFPRETAEGFVLSFAKAYFSSSQSAEYNKEEAFAMYADPQLIASIIDSNPTSALSVLEGPYIAGVRESSENDAVFTVRLLLSNNRWTYVEIPVQWNNDGTENSSFGSGISISGVPTIVAAPSLAEVSPDTEEFPIEEEATEAFSEVASVFFTAWGASNMDGLAAFTINEGSNRVVSGLQGAAKLASVDTVQVSEVIPGLDLGGPSTTWGVREARVTVNWSIPGTATEEEPDTLASYSSSYLMALTYDSTAQKWVVFDIRSVGLIPQ